MANRNDYQRREYQDRDYRFRDYDQRQPRQPEQFQEDRSRYDHRSYDYRHPDDRQFGDRDYDRQSQNDGWRDYSSHDSDSYRESPGGYSGGAYQDFDDTTRLYEGGSRYEEARPSHSSFRADDYGGTSFARGGPAAPGSGGGRSSHGFTGGRYRRDQGGNDRGFFDKAADEVASWFGDEEAERRRRRDHRGRGPANYERSNERLLEDACERLTHDSDVDARNITVTAENNEITLDGTVDSRWSKRRAEDCVHDISGVRHVQNNLRIDDRDESYRMDDTEMSGGKQKTT